MLNKIFEWAGIIMAIVAICYGDAIWTAIGVSWTATARTNDLQMQLNKLKKAS